MKKATPNNCLLCDASRLRFMFPREEDSLWQCESCSGIFAWPQIAQKDLEFYYDEITDVNYLLKYEQESYLRAKRILNYLDKKNLAGKILDVGCGCGFFLKMCQEQGKQAEGIEISKKAIELSKKFGDFIIYNEEITDCLKSLSTYSIISAQHILEHMKNPREFLSLLRNKLDQSGVLVIAIPNFDSWIQRWSGLQWVCLRERGHLFHFSPSAIEKLLSNVGFRLLDLQTPQWNCLDLVWAWRHRNEKYNFDKNNTDSEKYKSIKQSSFIRKNLSPLFKPLGWFVEYVHKGCEILAFAQKT